MLLGDTIVAVSSPAGAGERAILRLSGPRAVEISEGVFCASRAPGVSPGLSSHDENFSSRVDTPGLAPGARLIEAPTYTARTGRLEVAGLLVPATVYLMRKPRSYTREDVVEFHVGAWPALVGDLVAGLVAAGARPAEPGEFTFRALASGRLDLAQAEAVMAVINAADRATLRAAGDLLGGHLSAEIEHLAADLHTTLALVEVGLDFSDQDVPVVPPEEVAGRIDVAGRALADLGRRCRGLETFSGRVRLVVAGRPNAGKSSLFNRLLAADRAIVSPEAGTTRDELRAALRLSGLEFVISDTAGLEGATGTPAFQLGLVEDANGDDAKPVLAPQGNGGPDEDIAVKSQAKALAAIGGADLVLVTIDATASTYEDMDDILRLAAAPVVVAITKCDLAPPDRAMAWLESRRGQFSVIVTSAVTGQGLDALRQALVQTVEAGEVDRQAAGPVVTARHRAAMEAAAGALARGAHEAHRSGGAGELVAVELHESLDALGAILGRRMDADVLGTIFSQFCIGK
jgi:tRNA modification GTPase